MQRVVKPRLKNAGPLLRRRGLTARSMQSVQAVQPIVASATQAAAMPLRDVFADFVKTKACVHAADDDVYIRFLVCYLVCSFL